MAIENVGKFMSIVAENEEIQARMFELLKHGSKMQALTVLAKEYGEGLRHEAPYPPHFQADTNHGRAFAKTQDP